MYRTVANNFFLMQATAVDDNSARFTNVLQHVTTQIGDLSEEEKTSLKAFVEKTLPAASLEEEQQEIKLICEQMKSFAMTDKLERRQI